MSGNLPKLPLHQILIDLLTGQSHYLKEMLEEMNLDGEWALFSFAHLLMIKGHIPQGAREQCVEALLQVPGDHSDDTDIICSCALALIELNGQAALAAKLSDPCLDAEHREYLEAVQKEVSNLADED